ncbi:MAG: hypothetical protein WC043_04230 [Pseudobdellovibrionaceae bacterium]
MLTATFNKPSFAATDVVVRMIRGTKGSACVNDAWAINAVGKDADGVPKEELLQMVGRSSEDPHECDPLVHEIKQALELV